jgi:GNAT superfamily N-acetyltransferase
MHVAPLRPTDRAGWQPLAEGYKRFYDTPTTPAEYDECWRRLLAQDGVYGLAGFVDGRLVGIAHYLFHTSAWAPENCYLQDLFVAEGARGQGVAAALIDAVAQAARERKVARFYWLTQDTNARARALYDRVATYRGFIRYDYVVSPQAR